MRESNLHSKIKYKPEEIKRLNEFNDLGNEKYLSAIDLYDYIKKPTDDILSRVIGEYIAASGREYRLNIGDIDETLYKVMNFDSSLGGAINHEKFKELAQETRMDAVNNYKNEDLISPSSIQSGWSTFQSWHLTGGEKIQGCDIAHRFYIGIDSEYLHDFSLELYRNYKDAEIPFYFKILSTDNDKNKVEGRKDNIVIYTTTELLEQNLSILKSFEDNHSNLVEQCHEPSLLVGNIDNWLGYANEFVNGEKSYTSVMCECIAKGMDNTVRHWISQNPNFLLKDSGVSIEIKKYFGKDASITWDKVQDRLQRLLSVLPKVDVNFKTSVIDNIKAQLGNYGVDLNNIYFNREVETQMRSAGLM